MILNGLQTPDAVLVVVEPCFDPAEAVSEIYSLQRQRNTDRRQLHSQVCRDRPH